MATKNAWINADGIEVNFGPVVSDSLRANAQHTKGKTKELQLDVDVVAGLPEVGTARSAKDEFIPEGALIISARYVAEEDFDEAVEFGTANKDGTAIDQDGLIATGTGSAVGAGALIGTVATADSYLVVTSTSTDAAEGKGTLVVEYSI